MSTALFRDSAFPRRLSNFDSDRIRRTLTASAAVRTPHAREQLEGLKRQKARLEEARELAKEL
ncbi:MAG: hypothetical protein KC776_37435 [Myxococcales bacterium]|nr:hypothetical protein [Myxococcales bacterium]MCB9581411.1 hypothetical protein [Polyangiaceae bacterium]